MKKYITTSFRWLFVWISFVSITSATQASPEKKELLIGYKKVNEIAPLVVAQYKGFFEEEGLSVSLVANENWDDLSIQVGWGALDAAQLLAPQVVASGVGISPAQDLIAPMTLSRNGGAVTVSNSAWDVMKIFAPRDADDRVAHPIAGEVVKSVVAERKVKKQRLLFGITAPHSLQNYHLRYYLASGGIHPGLYTDKHPEGSKDAEVDLLVFPSTFMPTALRGELLDGYAVDEPWNEQAAIEKIGVPIVTNQEIQPHASSKVLGITAAFAAENPETVKALLKALIRAAQWVDENDGANHPELIELLRRPEFVGASAKVLEASLLGKFTFSRGDTRDAPDLYTFFRDYTGYPYYSDAIWFMTQMRRWGQIPEPKADTWFEERAREVYRPDLYLSAAQELVKEGHIERTDVPWDSDGYRAAPGPFFDGKSFDARTPSAYIDSFKIGLKSGDRVVSGTVESAATR